MKLTILFVIVVGVILVWWLRSVSDYSVLRVLISIVQGSKLFPAVVGDMGVLRRQIKIKARHENSPSQAYAKICACLERTD
jgi:hypothetical protein